VHEAVDKRLASGALGQRAPELLAGLVDRQVARLPQIECDELALDLAPVEVVVPQTKQNFLAS
jgi:hypothetical protein